MILSLGAVSTRKSDNESNTKEPGHIHHNGLYFFPTEAALTGSMEFIRPIADVPGAMKGDRAADGMHDRDETKGTEGRMKPK